MATGPEINPERAQSHRFSMDTMLCLDSIVHSYSVYGSRAPWKERWIISLTNSEDRVDLSNFVPLEIQVFLHAGYISIGEIAAIQLSTHQPSARTNEGRDPHNSRSTSNSRT